MAVQTTLLEGSGQQYSKVSTFRVFYVLYKRSYPPGGKLRTPVSSRYMLVHAVDYEILKG